MELVIIVVKFSYVSSKEHIVSWKIYVVSLGSNQYIGHSSYPIF